MEHSGENWPSDSDLGHSFSETGDPMMGKIYKKRREEELTERLLALLAAIPGLKKMDDTSILDKAINYVKQLEKRVRELEQLQKVESNICSSSKGTTTTCEVKSDDYHGTNDILPEVQARVSQNEVLVRIHCEKQKGIMPKILSQLENLHLSVDNSSVLRFGTTIDIITIVAQMGDGYNITVDELVKNLRIAISTQ